MEQDHYEILRKCVEKLKITDSKDFLEKSAQLEIDIDCFKLEACKEFKNINVWKDFSSDVMYEKFTGNFSPDTTSITSGERQCLTMEKT